MPIRLTTLRVLALLTIALSPTAAAAAPNADTPHYAVTRIGNLSRLVDDSARHVQTVDTMRSFSAPVALDADGDVLVGPQLYRNGRWRRVPYHPLKWPDGYAESDLAITAMNDDGDVVGQAAAVADGAWLIEDDVPLLFRRGRQSTLPSPPDADVADVVAINNHGQILMSAGTEHPDPSQDQTSYWIFDLRTHRFVALGGGEAEVLSDRGDVVMNDSLVTWRQGNKQAQPLGISMTSAGINRSDWIAGTTYAGKPDPGFAGSFITTARHAVVWVAGRTTALPGLGGVSSMAEGIDDRGQVVGLAQIDAVDNSFKTHAFLYRNGRTFDLNALIPARPRRNLTEALRINRRGQILADDGQYLYLLTPRREP